jgi:hypothetical protein
MALVKLPINKEGTKFAYVDPDNVTVVADSLSYEKECYICVKAAYATTERDGSLNVYLTSTEVIGRIGKSIVEKAER